MLPPDLIINVKVAIRMGQILVERNHQSASTGPRIRGMLLVVQDSIRFFNIQVLRVLNSFQLID